MHPTGEGGLGGPGIQSPLSVQHKCEKRRMKAPEYIPQSATQSLSDLLDRWVPLLDDIRSCLLSFAPDLEAHKDNTNPKHLAASELSLAQFFTFSSVAVLVAQAHHGDAFSLLRILYEGHLHLWNLCIGDEEQAERYLHLAAIQDWRIAKEAVAIEGTDLRSNYYDEARMNQLQARYEAASSYFGCRPGRVPRNYTTISNGRIAELIDAAESGSRPFRQLMHIRLYSAGSEYVHRSLFGIREGFAAIERETEGNAKWVMAPNPARGIEAAWWSGVIILDGAKWYAQLLDARVPDEMASLADREANLAAEWLGLSSPGDTHKAD